MTAGPAEAAGTDGGAGLGAVSDVLPLSPLQTGLFFHASLGTGDVYRYQLALDLAGPLDAALLRRCADTLLARHPALRTAFVAEETDEPIGVVLDGLTMPWGEADLSALTPAEQEEELRLHAVAERALPFALDRPPLLRASLVRLGPERHRLLLTAHHIVLDGWSVPVMVGDLGALYAAGGAPDALPRARPFRDYLEWVAGQDAEAARRTWREALTGVGDATLLVPGAEGSDTPAEPGRITVPCSAGLAARLTALARSRGVTANTVVQALWALLLGALTGRDDVVFGTVVTGRPPELPGADSMVGLFANTVPVRVRLRPDEAFSDLLARVHREQAALLDAPFLGLGEIQREAGLATLFDTLVVYENYPGGPGAELRAGADLTIASGGSWDATHYPLVLVAVPGDPLSLTLKYQPNAVSAQDAERIAERLAHLADEVVGDPALTAARVDPLTGAEREALRRVNATGAPVSEATVVDLFEEVAARDPDAVALRHEGGSLTYRELDARADRLAWRLRELGVDGERRVGLYFDRSPELVVSLLAVLKAGGAFVPIEPAWPRARVRAVVSDAEVGVVCSAQDADLPEGVTRVQVTPSETGPQERPDGPPPHRTHGDNAAYVIYTSGSTGAPKGAVIRHRSIANRLLWQAGLLGYGPGDAALFKAPLGFDISINEILLPLVTGARLVVAAPGEERDVEALLRLMAQERVSFCYVVSSMLAAMLEVPGFAGAAGPALRHVWCGGEPLTPELYTRFRSATGATMYHGYGPAETTVGVTHEVRRPGGDGGPPTLGRPNPNTAVHVLDRFLRPVPTGVVGELYIGGLLVGRGYVGDPARTAERFVADPFAADGSRLYRTGDLAARLPDGRLRFAGRVDNQVKIRGMRVAPEEVEAALGEHPAVRQAAVIAPADARGDHRLVAFCVPREAPEPPSAESAGAPGAAGADIGHGGAQAGDVPDAPKTTGLTGPTGPDEADRTDGARGTGQDGSGAADAVGGADAAQAGGGVLGDVTADPADALVGDLRAWARTRLAGHLVPAEIVIASRLPTLPSGKVDRRALAAAVPERRAAAQRPRTATEERLLDLFRATLERSDIGVTDDFFALGGHSLLATRLVVAARAALGTPLPVRALFEHTTAAGLAAYIDSGAAAEPARIADGVLLPLRAAGTGPALFCVHPVTGLAWPYAGLLRHVPDRPLYGVQAESLTRADDLPTSLDDMAARYVDAVRKRQPSGPYHLLGWSLGGSVAHLMACRLAAAGETVGSLTVLDAMPAHRLDGTAGTGGIALNLARLLAVNGYPVPEGEALTARKALALVAERGGPLAGFTADELWSVATSWSHSAGLRSLDAAPVFPGDLLLVDATEEVRPRDPSPASLWRPHVTGRVRTLPVASTHWQLTRPEPLAAIGAELRAELRRAGPAD
ncbi:amino acid adenylation domain-containing protein [Streptomyces sp. NPDC047002]|uniref:amino acid adenylation domain-containing protein n=1 Tax=Streptomyces sp. NPDC047002 TaxID=3155475 RepID=UPI003455B3AE